MKSIIISLLATALTLCGANRLPTYTRGVYLLLADNTASVFNDLGQSVLSTQEWSPRIGSWINQFNVVFFTFINTDMVVPPSFEHARSSGQIAPGTKIIYSIGGYSYSMDTQGWKKWFGNADSAKHLASQVAQWPCDGIDLDIEDGAGNDGDVAANMLVFAQELRKLRPNFIIT
jgi:hypothetical protein